MFRSNAFVLFPASVLFVAIATAACSGTHDEPAAATQEDAVTEAEASRPFGAPLAGLSADDAKRFADGLAEFEQVDGVADGLGPVFNDSSCAACHSAGATGGASERTVTRFATLTNGAFDPLARLGGSLVNAKGIGEVRGPNGETCTFVAEVVPPEATITTLRVTTPLFGLGLVDALADATLEDLAAREAREHPRTAGRVAHVTDIARGGLHAGKFGWKAQNPTLHQFAGDAYTNEMGITNPEFADESCPQGDCSLLRCNPSQKHPEDDGTDVAKFTSFMSLLAPPPRTRTTGQTRAGQEVFDETGCATCHWTTLRTGASSVAALSYTTFHPYSDFLLHDMGALGDGIEQGDAKGTEIRTAPLWGVRVRPRLLHDGRAGTLEEAISAHAGQGAAAAARFSDLGAGDRKALLAFVRSL